MLARPLCLPAQVVSRPVFESVVRDRWMNASERPAFTPWQESRVKLVVAATPSNAHGRRVTVTAWRSTWPSDQIDVVIDSVGRITSLAGLPLQHVYTPPRARWIEQADSADPRATETIPLSGELAWGLIPAVHPHRFARGARWVDTVDYRATWHGAVQQLRGVRVSTIVGDTVVAGATLWRVRDQMLATYHERVLSEDRTLGKLVTMERGARGTIRGEYLFNPVLGMSAIRVDTTVLRGKATLALPDGRRYTTATTYQRLRSFTKYDSLSYEHHRAAVARGRPEPPVVATLRQQVITHNAAVIDSLVAVWARARTPELRDTLRDILAADDERYYGASLHQRLDTLALRAGDTAFVFGELLARIQWTQPLDTTMVRFLLPFIRDPAHALAIGFTWGGYQALAYALCTYPLPGTVPGDVAPTARARAMLGHMWYSETDPRLRDIGLIALLGLDPRRWSDTVLAHAAGQPLLGEAANLAEGRVGSETTALPPEGSGWHAWADWAGASDFGPNQDGGPQLIVIDSDAMRALNFSEHLTGRDIIAEWKRQLATAKDDSARYTFEILLLPFGAWAPPSLDSIATLIRFGNAINYARGINGFDTAFARRGRPADSALTADIVDRLVAYAADDRPLWPTIRPSWDTTSAPPEADAVVSRPDSARRRVVLFAPVIPEAERARWQRQVTWLDAPETSEVNDSGKTTHLSITAVDVAGPFIQVRWAWRRGDDDGGGATILLRNGDGWMVVNRNFFAWSD